MCSESGQLASRNEKASCRGCLLIAIPFGFKQSFDRLDGREILRSRAGPAHPGTPTFRPHRPSACSRSGRRRPHPRCATARRRGKCMCLHRGVSFKVFKLNSYAPAIADHPCSTTSTQGKPASHLLWLISLCLLPLFECGELRLDVRRRQRRLVQIDHPAKTRDVADHENSLVRDHDIL